MQKKGWGRLTCLYCKHRVSNLLLTSACRNKSCLNLSIVLVLVSVVSLVLFAGLLTFWLLPFVLLLLVFELVLTVWLLLLLVLLVLSVSFEVCFGLSPMTPPVRSDPMGLLYEASICCCCCSRAGAVVGELFEIMTKLFLLPPELPF